MMKISIAFLAAMSLAGSGCHKDKADADQAGAIAKLTELKDKLCACKDKTCSDKVSDEYSRWTQAQAKPDGDKPGAPGEQDKKREELTEELTQCLLKLEVPSTGSAAGAAGAAGSAGSTGAAGSADGTTGSGNPAAGPPDGAAGSAAAAPAH
jgi:hypothetical protein